MQFGPKDSFILFGGGTLVSDTASWLLASGQRVVVFTSPRHAAEIVDESDTHFTDLLGQLGVETIVSDDINSDPRLSDHLSDSTLGISLGAAWDFSADSLGLFDHRLVNFHPVPLPRYRGGAHFSWQSLQRDLGGGLFFQLLEEQPDAGMIVYSETFTLPPDTRRPADYYAFSDSRYLPFVKAFINRVISGDDFETSRLPEELSLYMPRLSTLEQAFIDWSWTSDEILRFIDAFDDPYPGASTFIRGRRVFVRNCEFIESKGGFHPFQSGLVIRRSDTAAYVATQAGVLEINSLTFEDGTSAFAESVEGERLYTPSDILESALVFKAEYNAAGLVIS